MGSLLRLVCFIWLAAVSQTAHAITLPFFGSFGSRQPAPSSSSGSAAGAQYLQQSREPRIINADHGGPAASSSSGSSMPGGNIGVSPWISGTRDQFMRDQLVILHPDSPINREAWKGSGYLSPDFEHRPNVMNHGSLPLSPPPITTIQPHQQRARKLHRKPKQHTPQQQNVPKGVNEEPMGGAGPSPTAIPNNVLPPPPSFNLLPFSGGLYEIPSPVMYRDLNAPLGDTDDATVISSEPYPIIFSPFPLISPNLVPVSPRANNQAMPPDGVIQLLKSPEQEISPLTRPQVKLPFPLSRDCSSSGSGSKPLQFVVLPIVEPVAPLKPIIPKPPFLSSQSQYGHFPYIPPFNLFKKPISQLDSSNTGGSGGSGQFVPILNRPAPPLPFVFVQSLPLELIGHNVEMDVLQQPSPTTNTETKVREPITPPPSPSPTPVASENVASASRPLPLIVIEKVKTPGQQPSASGSAAAVVEISKQSIQKNANSGSSPLSTISVVRPITPPGSSATQEEIQKAIEKLVPVAAAVLQEQEKEPGRERDITNIAHEDEVVPREQNPPRPANITPSIVEPNNSIAESEKSSVTPLRSPLRPETTPEADYAQNPNSHKKPDISSSEEIGISTGMLRDIEVMEA